MRGARAVALAFVTAVLLAVSAVLPAVRAADGLVDALTKRDRERLAAFDEARASAIAEARKGGDAAEVAVLDGILAGGSLPLDDAGLTGRWRCRTAKLGGNLPLVVYGWFACRIDAKKGALTLTKTSGSQRTSGRFFDDGGGRRIYLGAGHYSDEKPKAHGADADRDEVAVLVRPDAKRLRLEFPLPRYESRFDILELQRR
ncbi:DUF4893 domain-containing protein [Rhodobium gokarnense]|uniref:DUF4893 domain-containing protein n=1 Tax=Rhodobium gokarnense TaxID=364296 RepID=A0ABT3HI07_9HYPH|nr:DUF4893 domain-containing protein [Rhodobium gokarnense]MCW2310046.1 hypothetical protein [Rhodobium gokarnense]